MRSIAIDFRYRIRFGSQTGAIFLAKINSDDKSSQMIFACHMTLMQLMGYMHSTVSCIAYVVDCKHVSSNSKLNTLTRLVSN